MSVSHLYQDTCALVSDMISRTAWPKEGSRCALHSGWELWRRKVKGHTNQQLSRYNCNVTCSSQTGTGTCTQRLPEHHSGWEAWEGRGDECLESLSTS
jgi:hypothetical protein